MTRYEAARIRYTRMEYRRAGASGLLLPPLSLGIWQNFGQDKPLETQAAVLRAAFDAGITQFDLANNYGPPHGSAEANFGRHLDRDLRAYRDELIITSKAGYSRLRWTVFDHRTSGEETGWSSGAPRPLPRRRRRLAERPPVSSDLLLERGEV